MELQEIYVVHPQPIETLVHQVDYVTRDVAEIVGPDLNLGGDLGVRSQGFERPAEVRLR